MHRSSNAFLPQSFHERKNPHIYTPIEKSSIHNLNTMSMYTEKSSNCFHRVERSVEIRKSVAAG